MISSPRIGQLKQKSCSHCGASFICGPQAGDKTCWCDKLPHVSLVVRRDQGCLCPTCLSETILKLPSGQNDAEDVCATMTGEMSQPLLVEGEDYYCEGSTIVFTTRYHLRRGYCCESGCRHCPYSRL